MCSASLADEIRIPFSCWPKELQQMFLEYNRKLDLSANDRTNNSWGYIASQGSSYSIFTYLPVTEDDFYVIREIVFKIEDKNK